MLQVGGAGILGVNFDQLLAAEAVADNRPARAKSVIFVFLMFSALAFYTLVQVL